MTQLIAHLVGDYVLQNHWMANTKTKSSFAALVHVLLYGVPFLFLVGNAWQWLIIVGTHFGIDRWRLAKYWVEGWGVGYWPSRLRTLPGVSALIGQGYGSEAAHQIERERLGVQDADPWMSVWLLIIVDNTLHMVINYSALRWL